MSRLKIYFAIACVAMGCHRLMDRVSEQVHRHARAASRHLASRTEALLSAPTGGIKPSLNFEGNVGHMIHLYDNSSDHHIGLLLEIADQSIWLREDGQKVQYPRAWIQAIARAPNLIDGTQIKERLQLGAKIRFQKYSDAKKTSVSGTVQNISDDGIRVSTSAESGENIIVVRYEDITGDPIEILP